METAMRISALPAAVFTLLSGAAFAQPLDMPERNWQDLVGPTAAFRACPYCQFPGYRDPGGVFDPRWLHEGTIAGIPGYTDDNLLGTQRITVCTLARQELQGSGERFSLCNVTWTNVEVTVNLGGTAMKITLGANSFVSIHASAATSVVSIGGVGAIPYQVSNGQVYSLETTSGMLVLNEFSPQ
jgi:hypothetical protein